MKERPILFSGPMVRAILDGTKTQTRRVVKQVSEQSAQAMDSCVREGGKLVLDADGVGGLRAIIGDGVFSVPIMQRCPYGVPGDRLWVKEAIRCFEWMDGGETSVEYVATPGVMHDDAEWVWKRDALPGMFMPRGLSRLTLTITGVRVERLQDISEEDARAEGIDTSVVTPSPVGLGALKARHYATAREFYRDLWDLLNAKRASWSSNPWVWVVSFKREESNP